MAIAIVSPSGAIEAPLMEILAPATAQIVSASKSSVFISEGASN